MNDDQIKEDAIYEFDTIFAKHVIDKYLNKLYQSAESGELMETIEYENNPYPTMSQQDIRREFSGTEFWNEDKGDRA